MQLDWGNLKNFCLLVGWAMTTVDAGFGWQSARFGQRFGADGPTEEAVMLPDTISCPSDFNGFANFPEF